MAKTETGADEMAAQARCGGGNTRVERLENALGRETSWCCMRVKAHVGGHLQKAAYVEIPV